MNTCTSKVGPTQAVIAAVQEMQDQRDRPSGPAREGQMHSQGMKQSDAFASLPCSGTVGDSGNGRQAGLIVLVVLVVVAGSKCSCNLHRFGFVAIVLVPLGGKSGVLGLGWHSQGKIG